MSNADELVTVLFESVFGRQPDPDGLASWAARVNEGVSASELIAGLLASDEAVANAPFRSNFAAPEQRRLWADSDLASATPDLLITDVGAAPLDYEDDVYGPLLRTPGTRLTCFEPNPERAKAAAAKHPHATVVESCVADGTTRQFYETHAGVTSSLYPPNPRTTLDLLEVGDEMALAETYQIDTVRLDDVAAAVGTDFLKLDVQAAERDVLANAQNVLAAAVAVHTELEFFPLYNDQPLGWEVWRELDLAGYDLYWFHHLQPYRMRTLDNNPIGPPRRLGWGDAVFFPKPDNLLSLNAKRALNLCAIWHDVYGARDHCLWLLEQHPDPEVRSHLGRYRDLATPPR